MTEDEIVYVAVVPRDGLDNELAKGVAHIIGRAPYETRLLLVGSIPRVIARCRGAREAEAAARSLKELGLATIVCSDAELRSKSRGFRAQTMDFDAGEVVFRREDGLERKIKMADVCLIIKGTMQPHVEAEESKTVMKFGVGKSVLTAGLPVLRKVKEKSNSPTSQMQWFARLHERGSSDPAVEMLQFDIDYSFLGEETAPSSLTNFTAVINRLRQLCPQAVYDERLLKTYGTDIPMTTDQEDIDINCRLIYFQHLM